MSIASVGFVGEMVAGSSGVSTGLGFCWSRIARTWAAMSGSSRMARSDCRLAGDVLLVVVDACVDESDSGTSCLVFIVPSSWY